MNSLFMRFTKAIAPCYKNDYSMILFYTRLKSYVCTKRQVESLHIYPVVVP